MFGTPKAEWLTRPASRARNEFASAIRTPKRHISTTCRAERAFKAANHCISSIGERGVAALTYGSHLQHATSPPLTRGHRRISGLRQTANTHATSRLELGTTRLGGLAVADRQDLLLRSTRQASRQRAHPRLQSTFVKCGLKLVQGP